MCMINMKEIINLLNRAGLIPAILVIGGWVCSFILIIMLLYNILFGKKK